MELAKFACVTTPRGVLVIGGHCGCNAIIKCFWDLVDEVVYSMFASSGIELWAGRNHMFPIAVGGIAEGAFAAVFVESDVIKKRLVPPREGGNVGQDRAVFGRASFHSFLRDIIVDFL